MFFPVYSIYQTILYFIFLFFSFVLLLLCVLYNTLSSIPVAYAENTVVSLQKRRTWNLYGFYLCIESECGLLNMPKPMQFLYVMCMIVGVYVYCSCYLKSLCTQHVTSAIVSSHPIQEWIFESLVNLMFRIVLSLLLLLILFSFLSLLLFFFFCFYSINKCLCFLYSASYWSHCCWACNRIDIKYFTSVFLCFSISMHKHTHTQCVNLQKSKFFFYSSVDVVVCFYFYFFVCIRCIRLSVTSETAAK